MKKFLSSLLSVMMLTSMAVSAGTVKPATVWTGGYLPGESEHVVGVDDCISTQNALKAADGVQINAGGSATWGFNLPYAVRSVKIIYSGGGEITFSSERNTYNPIKLESGTDLEYKLEFGVNLGKDKDPQYRTWGADYGILKEYGEHEGEKEITITSVQGVKIKSLIFEKEITMGPNTVSTRITKFSDDEKIQKYSLETMTTVLIHKKSPYIVVGGGRRYIDNNNIATRPYFHNGKTYLPINTVAKALGYYHEVIPQKDFVLMRSDMHEFVMLDGKCTITEGLGKTHQAPDGKLITHDGQIMAEVKYFSELAGKTYESKDDLIVIDDKYTVKDILNDEEFFNFALEYFKGSTDESPKGKTYYVAQSASASDKNNGSALAPFKTLAMAASVVQPGDTVIVRGGTYREVLTPQVDGTANAPITFRAAKGERVILSATEPLGKPALYDKEKGVYVYGMNIDMGLGKNQIFIDGKLQTEARYPNDAPGHITSKESSNSWGVRGELIKKWGDHSAFQPGGEMYGKPYDSIKGMYDSVDYDTIISDTLLNQEDDYWKGGIYVGAFPNSYAMTTGLIESSSSGKLIISREFRNQRWWWNSWCNGQTKTLDQTNNLWNWGMIVGHKNAMDLPGEWVKYNDENRMYIILPEGLNPDTANVEAKARMLVADLTGRKFVNLEGFETLGGSVVMKDSEMCMLNNMNMRHIAHYNVAADAHSGYNDFPYDNTKDGSPQRGEVGIYISGRDNIVTNSIIDHSAAAGLYLTGTYTYIENNIINDCGYMGSYVSGIHADTVPWENSLKPRGGYAIYNNTIYNTGRACIDFCRNEYTTLLGTPESKYSHGNAPYIGCDIAYNDLHDSALQTQDGGTIYSNGTNGGFYKKFSTVHNNYLYKTLSNEDFNHYEALLYWDGNAHGYDTFNNIIFVSGDSGPRMEIIQNYTGNEAYCRQWNNQKLGTISLDENLPVADALINEYFSENKPFYAGSFLKRENPYLNNYNRFRKEDNVMEYTAANADTSEGVTIGEDGYAVFTEDGQYLHFKNVDFGKGSNEMVVSFKGDSHWTYDKLELTIGTGENTSIPYELTVPQHDQPGFDQVCTMRFMIDMTSGVHDVRLKVKDYKSVRIGGIATYTRETKIKTDEFSHLAYVATYKDRNGEKDDGSGVGFMTQDGSMVTDNPYANGVKSTWAGNTVRYTNQTISEDSEYFVMAAGSRDQYRRQLVRVYVCEPTKEFIQPTGDYVAEFRTLNQNFYDTTPRKVPLLKEVKAGTYDIYLELVDEGYTATSNMLYFGFLKKGVENSKISSSVHWQGGKFDKALSVQDEERPFGSWALDRQTPRVLKLVNTMPGTVAGYSNIEALTDSSKMRICYGAKAEYAEQPINIRIDDPTGTTVAKAKFITEASPNNQFNEIVVDLDTKVPEGVYNVFLEFGGKKGSGQTCQIGWFAFEQ